MEASKKELSKEEFNKIFAQTENYMFSKVKKTLKDKYTEVEEEDIWLHVNGILRKLYFLD